MNRGASCGASVGTDLKMLPVMEMTWEKWKEIHPDTKVISSGTGFSRNYTTSGYPYGDPRIFLRAGSSLFGVNELPVAVALRGGVKLTTGAFENDAETISLSQGQRDWSLLLEVGKSLHPLPMYVSGGLDTGGGRKMRRLLATSATNGYSTPPWAEASIALSGRWRSTDSLAKPSSIPGPGFLLPPASSYRSSRRQAGT